MDTHHDRPQVRDCASIGVPTAAVARGALRVACVACAHAADVGAVRVRVLLLVIATMQQCSTHERADGGACVECAHAAALGVARRSGCAAAINVHYRCTLARSTGARADGEANRATASVVVRGCAFAALHIPRRRQGCKQRSPRLTTRLSSARRACTTRYNQLCAAPARSTAVYVRRETVWNAAFTALSFIIDLISCCCTWVQCSGAACVARAARLRKRVRTCVRDDLAYVRAPQLLKRARRGER
jgi:hypothetical protein